MIDGATMTDIATTRIYNDFGGLADLKREARDDNPAALKEVGKQFESMLLHMVIKSMRQANEAFKSDLLDNNNTQFYEQMFDQQISLHLGESGSLGLAEMIERQLSHETPSRDKKVPEGGYLLNQDDKKQSGFPLHNGNNSKAFPLPKVDGDKEFTLTDRDKSMLSNLQPAVEKTIEKVANEVTEVVKKVRQFNTAEEFVDTLLPIATPYAEKIGVDPKLLVAQAALESGWGRSMIQGASQGNSYNLFGIKSHNWQGENVKVVTHEYRDGKKIKETANFRGYGSYEESFADYVEFLRSNPRYKEALSKTDNPSEFANALQAAGYATDPNYAKKIMSIFNSNVLQRGY